MKKHLVLLILIWSNYAFAQDLPGFTMLAGVLLETKPGRDNVVEWVTIRNDTVSSSHKSDDERLYDLAVTMSGIEPGLDNKVEWANIRQTCNEIVSGWGDTEDKTGFYRKLLNRLKEATPGRDNLDEWRRIRKTANEILRNI